MLQHQYKPFQETLSMQNLSKELSTTSSKPLEVPGVTGTAHAGVIFSTLSSPNAAYLLPIIPVIIWVLFNALQPALNQINKMRSVKGVIIRLGLDGLAWSSFVHPPEALASKIVMIADAGAAALAPKCKPGSEFLRG